MKLAEEGVKTGSRAGRRLAREARPQDQMARALAKEVTVRLHAVKERNNRLTRDADELLLRVEALVRRIG
jgi:hypothetical protein